MAQRSRIGAGQKARRLARRFGVTGGRAAAIVLVALCVVVAGVGYFALGAPRGVEIERGAQAEPGGSAKDAGGQGATPGESPSDSDNDSEPLVVHIDGAVAAPGVYAVPAGSRVNDAVQAAGGLAEGADTSTTNLAAPVSDGVKVHIPTAEETHAPAQSADDGAAAQGSAAQGAGSPQGGLVNINSATSSELQALSGVGEATAAAIIEDRESKGPFTSPEDLMRVSGIGEKKFAKIKDHICV